MRPSTHRLVLALATLMAGCSSEPSTLYVDLVTDMRPAIEWDGVELHVDGRLRAQTLADVEVDYLGGQRVADVALPDGNRRVELVLVNEGAEILRRPVSVMVDGPTAITIVVSRECRGVECPLDDPALEACLAGVCVDPQCTPETPEACPVADCTAETDCAAPLASCASARCVDGVCLATDDGSCGPGMYCEPLLGCLDAPPPPRDPRQTSPGTRDGLIVHLPLDEDTTRSGLAIDASGNGHDAVCARSVSCPAPVPGRFGAGVVFDGGQQLRVPHAAELDTPDAFTVAVWVMLGTTESVVPVAKALGAESFDSWAFVHWSSGGVCLETTTAAGAENICAGSLPIDRWVHLAGTWDGATKALYVDGARSGSWPMATTVAFDGHDVVLGSDENSGSPAYQLTGSLDDFRLYGRALTSAEIAELAAR